MPHYKIEAYKGIRGWIPIQVDIESLKEARKREIELLVKHDDWLPGRRETRIVTQGRELVIWPDHVEIVNGTLIKAQTTDLSKNVTNRIYQYLAEDPGAFESLPHAAATLKVFWEKLKISDEVGHEIQAAGLKSLDLMLTGELTGTEAQERLYSLLGLFGQTAKYATNLSKPCNHSSASTVSP